MDFPLPANDIIMNVSFGTFKYEPLPLSFQFELLFRRSVLSPAYKQTIIDKFENGTLKVFFRLYLDRRKIPRSITNIEDTIEDIIAKETYSMSSLFKDLELDLASINVKRKQPDVGFAISLINRNLSLSLSFHPFSIPLDYFHRNLAFD